MNIKWFLLLARNLRGSLCHTHEIFKKFDNAVVDKNKKQNPKNQIPLSLSYAITVVMQKISAIKNYNIGRHCYLGRRQTKHLERSSNEDF